jgi:ArsR family transcriptional regulator, lead/cadmium/zinc/bismuth-responsive transcriptional repressor
VSHPPYVTEWADRFAVLGDPSRLSLLLLLRERGPISVNDLAEASGLRPTTTSHALRLMRIARLVATERDGRLALYRLVDPVITELLEHVTLPDLVDD